MNREPTVDRLLRDLAPAVLGSLVRRSGDFEAAEDAVQEALIAAATQWPKDGIPANPKGWLVTVATRRRIEEWRAADARRRREEAASRSADAIEPETVGASDRDDSLLLLMLCCHPALTPASQIALT
ncbi:MAG TPA: sigma factor, partial [Candidatus Limnocylindrales bacterium]